MQYNQIEIGNRIYSARTKKGLKQIEVSNTLGISQSLYSKIETGKYDITLSTLFDLSNLFEVSIEWLLGIKDNKDLTDIELLELEKFKKYLISQRKTI